MESYLRYQGQSFINRFDANSYLYITRAIDQFDLVQAYGSLEAAFAPVQAESLVVGFTSDWLFPPEQNRSIALALLRAGKRASYAELATDLGHDSFLLESEELYALVRGFLEREDAVVRFHDLRAIQCRSSSKSAPWTCRSSGTGSSRSARVLDLGCGRGQLLDYLVQTKQVSAVGVDLDFGKITACVRRGVCAYQGDMTAFMRMFPERHFDRVICSRTVHELNDPGRGDPRGPARRPGGHRRLRQPRLLEEPPRTRCCAAARFATPSIRPPGSRAARPIRSRSPTSRTSAG